MGIIEQLGGHQCGAREFPGVSRPEVEWVPNDIEEETDYVCSHLKMIVVESRGQGRDLASLCVREVGLFSLLRVCFVVNVIVVGLELEGRVQCGKVNRCVREVL